ncbi:DEAD/DEAH box helicase [Campylobacter geochelonis]|uniref:Putative ATP-dependent RNA helicase RhlE n=1 Tax=Campylobacter geochelonis TaxID=1780362 RepID=A0A128EIL2_9BACT|nr:DEAD/DEAH box helicase [Campylobacter geochelonis]QKF70779.1 DEAD-box ATP-dependent RNA helicase [Campylobacter geochelonis]CZE48646.1 putative ATP-dependent RNA helicase RhlE [Campylobacter geochelonis]
MQINEFSIFGLDQNIEQALLEAGFKTPSPVQKEAIPLALEGFDMVVQAHTGTGKTAAFGLPIMSKMVCDGSIETLVVTPTRELCIQVSDELYRLGKYKGVKTASIYGGQSYSRQISQVNGEASIIVATPGRLLDLLKSGKIEINPKFIILDEADEMLDMGFLDDIKEILKFTPPSAQKLLFSATMPEPIKKIAKEFLHDAKYVKIVSDTSTNVDIEQEYYVVEESERTDATIRLIDFYEPQKAIIFCRMKKEADALAHTLLAKGHPSKALHGDMDQKDREATIRAFKKGDVEILVATDVAARGLDIDGVSHVFNYHIPFNPQSYVHRIGRTGRAGHKGLAITLVSPQEFRDLQRIKQSVGGTISHKFIPSLDAMSEDLNNKLVEQIFNYEVDENAPKILTALEEVLTPSQIAYKMISILLDANQLSGPQSIGLDAQNIERILEKYKKGANDKSRNSRQRRGSRDGRDSRGSRDSKRSGYKKDGARDSRSEGRSEFKKDDRRKSESSFKQSDAKKRRL